MKDSPKINCIIPHTAVNYIFENVSNFKYLSTTVITKNKLSFEIRN